MNEPVPDILARIVARKRSELTRTRPLRAQLEARAGQPRRGFRRAIETRAPSIIAEIKHASPSRGVLNSDFDPVRQARDYETGGAAALSVLTDEHFFQGSLAHLAGARDAVSLPVLRKDFVIDEFHILEAAAYGADAILLITTILTEGEIRDFHAEALRYGMDALVEVHDEHELDIALAAGADLIGVNNRDLHTFEVTLDTSLRLAEKIPPGVLKISESGIHSRGDIDRLMRAGYQAFLVGEHLMKSGDAVASLRALVGAA